MIPNESKCLVKSFLQQKAVAAGVICFAVAGEFGSWFTPTCSGEGVEEVKVIIRPYVRQHTTLCYLSCFL